MRKLLPLFLAVFVFTSCDNLVKKKTNTDDKEDTKIKKPLDDDETSDDDKVKKSRNNDDDEDTKTTKRRTNNDDDDNNTNYSSGWSSADKNAFMNSCVDGAKEKMGESGAENYCSCMQQKIEKIYPNSQDAGSMSKSRMTELAQDCLNQ